MPGTSSGLGRSLVQAVLARGDRVIATARKLDSIRDLVSNPNVHLVQLDVTEPFAVLRETAARAVERWGRVDVVVNNAGAGMLGISEEVGVEGYQRQFATNFFGALNVTHAFLPHMRARRAGTITFIGSRSSWRSNVPMLGTYASSKAALSSAAEALSVELAPLNIRVLTVLPGGLRTSAWDNMNLLPTAPDALLPPLSASASRNDVNTRTLSTQPHATATSDGEQHLSDYADLRTRQLAWMYGQIGKEPGDPDKCALAIVDVVGFDDGSDGGEGDRNTKAERGRGWPELGMLVLGSDAEANVREKCVQVVRNLDEWADVVRGVDISG
ncbi:NAD-binding protein [Phellopilus nigrolimitatus]|nr:NAD-binding protein [Phellopilus nigrolimitatus]